MDHLHPYALRFGLLLVATGSAAFYCLYSVCSSLYQGFVDFSRRFRGVE